MELSQIALIVAACATIVFVICFCLLVILVALINADHKNAARRRRHDSARHNHNVRVLGRHGAYDLFCDCSDCARKRELDQIENRRRHS